MKLSIKTSISRASGSSSASTSTCRSRTGRSATTRGSGRRCRRSSTRSTQGATVVLATHLGRPKGKANAEMSLRPVAERLAQLLGRPVAFADDCIGDARRAARVQRRRRAAREPPLPPRRGKQRRRLRHALASLADVYVNDAFGAAHRAHASVEAITRCFERPAAGLLMEKELQYLGHALEKPERPFVAILGGAKVSDKIDVIENLLGKVDRLLIGGAMAYTFFKARGVPVGRSLVEDDKLDEAQSDRGATRHGARRGAAAADRSRRGPEDRSRRAARDAGGGRRGDRRSDGARHRPGDDRGIHRGDCRREDGGLERPDGRVRDRRVRKRHQRRRRGGGGGQRARRSSAAATRSRP